MRSIYCGEPNESNLDQEVTLCGWVHRRRDHGGVIFVDLRDHSGLLQVVFDPDTEETFATAERVRNEFVLQVQGRVRRRPEGTVNPDMPTGEVEVLGTTLTVLNAAETPPFHLDDQDVTKKPGCAIATSTCVVPRCRRRSACVRALPTACAASSMRTALSMSRRRS